MRSGGVYQTSYDKSACKIGWVHLGYGAFHRAHQAVYLDDYMQATGDLRWGIAAVNLRAEEAESFAAAGQADAGYVLKSIGTDGSESYRMVRAHQAMVDASQSLDQAVALLTRPDVHVLSVTVTESGYSYDEDWTLDLAADPIQHDLQGGAPRTVYGFLALALGARMAHLDAPITLLCCDNIRSNGTHFRSALLAFLEASGADALAEWVRQNAAFPCAMVDRITPRSTPELAAEIAQLSPDNAVSPIHAEDFIQWVLQDDFAAPMPDLGQVGVQIVDDVEPFEEAKIRILNGGHTGLCYLGALAGHLTFDAAMNDAALFAHFERFERGEVLKGLDGAIPFDTLAYLDQIIARFRNAGIADQLERICMDGYSKMSIYLRPTMADCLAQGIRPQASYQCVASWVVFARKAQAGAVQVPYHEPRMDMLAPMIVPGQEERLARDANLWGDLPRQYSTFVPDLIKAIEEMEQTWRA